MESATAAVESASTSAVNTSEGQLSGTSEHCQYQAKEKDPQNTRPIHFVPPQLRATATTSITIVGRISHFWPRKSFNAGANHSATSQANYPLSKSLDLSHSHRKRSSRSRSHPQSPREDEELTPLPAD
jgi:hypothetical protein